MTKFTTASGEVLTDEDIEALADEAERGYDRVRRARGLDLLGWVAEVRIGGGNTLAFSLAPALDRKEKVAALRELFHRVTAQPAHARISKARLEMKSIQIPLIEDLELVRDKTVIRGRMNIAVPLRNVGSGLAVVLPALITAGGQRIGAIEGTYVQSKLVPPGETTRVVCAPRLTQLEAASYPWIVILKVPYQDFTAGQ